MRHRPLATAAAAALVLGVVAGPAAARGTAAETQTAAGTATSALNLLSLALAGHAVDVGRVALTSDTVTGNPVAKVVVTPLKVDGTTYGEQTVTSANSPASVPTVDSAAVVPAALAGLASVKSPVFDVSATTADGASTKAGTASLGSVSVLGIPLKLDGSVNVGSLVNATNAVGQKTVTVKNVALPSVADLLAALGLNLPALPVDTLTKLLKDLNLTSTAVTTATAELDKAMATIKAQVDAAQAEVDKAAAALAAKTTELTGAQSQLAAAEAELASKVTALNTAKAQLATVQAGAQPAIDAYAGAVNNLNAALAAAGTTLTAYKSDPALQAALGATVNPLIASADNLKPAADAAQATVNQAVADVASAQSAVDVATAAVNVLKNTVATLQAAVDALQKTLDDLIALLKSLLTNVQPLIDTLIGAITALLDGTPLVSIDSLTVQTQALVKSASAGGQTAKVTGGELVGLKVLGTDVLQNALGNTKVDLLSLVGGTLNTVTSTINGLTGTLSSVLSNVPSFPTLSIPAPQIGVLTKTASTDIAGGFGIAENSVKALSITIPAITLPSALALPNASSLPAISGLPLGAVTDAVNAAGNLVSKPVTLSMVTLSEQSKFRPALTAAPGTNPPGTTPPGDNPTTLPTTGLPAGIALIAVLMVGFGLAMRRRLADGTQV